jgi:hypothetical protein
MNTKLEKTNLLTVEDIDLLRKQENLYWKSSKVNKKWYRKIYGGTWKCFNLCNDTRNSRICVVWTKMDNDCWNNKKIITVESYPVTNVDTRKKFYIQLFRNILRINYPKK